jgi:hypothetical protein
VSGDAGTPSRRAQIGKSRQMSVWPLRMSSSASGVCPVGRLPDQLLIDRVVFGVRSVPSRRIAAGNRLRGVAIAHGRSLRIIRVVPPASLTSDDG